MGAESLGAQRHEDNAGAKVFRPEEKSRHAETTRQTQFDRSRIRDPLRSAAMGRPAI
jgi:hypothetical protein